MTRSESIEAAARAIVDRAAEGCDIWYADPLIDHLAAALSTADCSTGSISQMGIAIPGSSLTAGQSAICVHCGRPYPQEKCRGGC